LDFNLGDSIPAYCSSSGKMMLSSYSPRELDEYFKKVDIIKYQSSTLCDEDSIRKELKKITAAGFAVHNEEYIAGIFCISFPLYINSKLTGALTLITELKNRSAIYNMKVIDEIKNKLNAVK